MPELLEFEEPVGVLLKEIEALSMLPQTPERQKSIESLRRRADEIRAEIDQLGAIVEDKATGTEWRWKSQAR